MNIFHFVVFNGNTVIEVKYILGVMGVMGNMFVSSRLSVRGTDIIRAQTLKPPGTTALPPAGFVTSDKSLTFPICKMGLINLRFLKAKINLGNYIKLKKSIRTGSFSF